MHKKHSTSQLKQTLSDVTLVGLSTIVYLSENLSKNVQILKDNKIKDKELTEEEKKELQTSIAVFENVLTIINDVLHPSHSMMLELHPQFKSIIDVCIENHEKASKKGLVIDKCKCFSCKTKIN